MPDITQYLVRIDGADALLKVVGKAGYLNCSNAGLFFARIAEKRCKSLEIELSECAGMDSTFLGMIAGAALKMRKFGARVSLVNASERICELAENLGLDRLVEVRAAAPELPEQPANPLENAGAAPRAILEAHENLVAADAKNAEKFEDVISFLRREIPPTQ